MSIHTSNGYDAAQEHRAEDDLDRWRFAAEIVELATSTPKDWSARIGIFGKWGDGKTTVLRFAERMLTQGGNVVFWFNPWAIQNWNDLWEEFGSRLWEALDAAGIPVDSSWKQAAKNSARWLDSVGARDVVQAGAALVGREKVADAAFGLLSRWLRLDGPQIRSIQEKVKDRRLVVLIDDLDRSAPSLIPQLLLSLRELLDLPGFTFLLAFDDEIVGQALTNNNPAWSDGSDFLEKTLDFRYHLPPVSGKQKERFVSGAITKYCSFVPQESAKEVQDVLPNNPRKLKTLIRSLAALGPQISRHDPDELNWVDMWLAQMLRLESYPFFERLLSGNTLESETGTLYRLLATSPRGRFGHEKQEGNESIRKLMEEAGVKEKSAQDRLIRLIEAIRSRSSSKFKYMCELALRPQAVTWKEFRLVYAKWAADRRPQVLDTWIKQHAVDRAVSTEDVSNELFQAIVESRQQYLVAAAQSISVDELASNARECEKLLEMSEHYLLGLRKLGVQEFGKLYGQATYWIGFRKNPGDRDLRGQEQALLVNLVSSASNSLAMELFEVVYPKNVDYGFGEGVGERQALRDKCMSIILPRVAKEAITFLEREGGIRSLTERGRFSAVKYCLFTGESPIWQSSLRDELIQLISDGRKNNEIYENVREYFSLLVQGLENGVDTVSREEIAAIISDKDLLHAIWQTLMSKGIQYRMQMTYIQARKSLIENGTPPEILPLSEDLLVRLREEGSQNGLASGAPPAEGGTE